MDYEKKLVEILKKKTKRPPGAAALAKKLGVEDVGLFKEFLRELEEQGVIAPAGRNGYALPGRSGRYAGTYVRDFGGGGIVKGIHEGIKFEIHVPEGRTGEARPGDRVLVEITGRRGARKKDENILRASGLGGKVIKVYGSLDPSPVGIVVRNRYRRLSVLLSGQAGKRWVTVTRPGRDLEPGDVVRVRIVERPGRDDAAEVIEIVGDLDDPAADADVIALSMGIPVKIPGDAVREAEEIPASSILEEAPGRLDLTGELCATVDPDDAKDFDDAVSCRRTKNGWRLGVHIADVSFFAPAGSALDRAALERGTTVYLPGRVIPMLPERLANDLCSLRPGEPRLAKSVHMTVSKDGAVSGVKVSRALIKSAHRFTYDGVGAILRNETKAPTPALGRLLRAMRACSRALRNRRTKNGALFLNIPKPDVTLAADGTLEKVEPEKQDEPHWIIEEFMVAANQAVAGYLIGRGAPYIARLHPEPSEELLEALSEFLRDRGHGVGNRPSRHELQGALESSAGKKGAGAIHLAVLKSMQRAEYSPHRGIHYALATDEYLHFTSPIRRYPDLHVHQTLDAILRGEYNAKFEERLGLSLPGAATLATLTEKRAEKAEREVVTLKILRHLSDKLGLECHATVSGVSEYGVFCTLDEFLVDGRISLDIVDRSDIRRDRYTLTAYTPTGRMRFTVGDRVRVTIEKVDLIRRELDLAPVARTAGGARKKKKSTEKKRARKTGRKDQPLRTHYRGRRGRRR